MKTASVNRLYTQRQSMGMCVLYVAVICFLAIVAAKMTIEFLDIFKSMDFHLEEMLRQESEVVPAGHTSSSRTKSLASLKTASNHPSTSPFGQANCGNLDTIQTFLRPVLEKWMVKSEGRQKDPLLRVSQPFGRRAMKVLIVEDDAASREYLIDGIESLGHETREAEDGSQGLEVFYAFHPDLVLSDVQMPKMNGLELLETIRGENPETIVVIMTAFGSEKYAVRALRAGASNYLSKPLRLSELGSIIQKYQAIVDARMVDREVIGSVVCRSFTMRFDNRIERAAKIAERLVQETGDRIDANARLGVRLGLLELLTNAMEHGNLGITYDEKTDAQKHGPDGFMTLYQARMAEETLSARRVTVDFDMDESSCEWVIRDEGNGFDWRALPDPTKSENLLASHGRGVFLARLQFDELEYWGNGRAVRASIKLSGPNQTSGEGGIS